ncbi:hypothetical protein [Marinobacter sp. X15-166B]|uniref:hypothetical protein n=1 Tax=Marinobacter sp. X15-166B TaxID=1897620 RepID=UPI00085CD63B|nr:hypothetical protein [Marinobacter sp. X15-166B]OEY65292.1 hypothetical protein BG841_01660 [Marinobacter sp. X15-166B]
MRNHAYRPVSGRVHTLLTRLRASGAITEVVYRDSTNRIQSVHDCVKDLFHRAGEDFVLLGRGELVRLDQVMMVDGLVVSPG